MPEGAQAEEGSCAGRAATSASSHKVSGPRGQSRISANVRVCGAAQQAACAPGVSLAQEEPPGVSLAQEERQGALSPAVGSSVGTTQSGNGREINEDPRVETL